jgi:hypothetical protein
MSSPIYSGAYLLVADKCSGIADGGLKQDQHGMMIEYYSA